MFVKAWTNFRSSPLNIKKLEREIRKIILYKSNKRFKNNNIKYYNINNFSDDGSWKEMSRSKYTETILDYAHNEYADGNWHNSRWQ